MLSKSMRSAMAHRAELHHLHRNQDLCCRHRRRSECRPTLAGVSSPSESPIPTRSVWSAKQHGGLAYTLTLLPGEKMTLYHSDRYRRTTSETQRYSVQTTFSQFVSALYQQQNSSDSSALIQVLNNESQSSSSSSGGGFNLFGLGGASTSSGKSSSSDSSSAVDLSTQTSANQFLSLAQQASQYTDLQRSITISSYEDTETVSTTQRTVVNNNICYAVTYFVRKVLDVYVITTKVTAVTFQVTAGNFVSAVLTPAQIGLLPAQYQKAVEAALKGLPTVGEVIEQPTVLTVPTDGVVYDPELAHCCALDPELEEAAKIKLGARAGRSSEDRPANTAHGVGGTAPSGPARRRHTDPV